MNNLANSTVCNELYIPREYFFILMEKKIESILFYLADPGISKHIGPCHKRLSCGHWQLYVLCSISSWVGCQNYQLCLSISTWSCIFVQGEKDRKKKKIARRQKIGHPKTEDNFLWRSIEVMKKWEMLVLVRC